MHVLAATVAFPLLSPALPGRPWRVAELLLDPWLATNGVAFTELPVVSPEPVDWPAKARGFLAAKFLGRKYEGSF